jgi:hypothetical protein
VDEYLETIRFVETAFMDEYLETSGDGLRARVSSESLHG